MLAKMVSVTLIWAPISVAVRWGETRPAAVVISVRLLRRVLM